MEEEKIQTFYIFRMLPPDKAGHKYFFTLKYPNSPRKETFIDVKVRRVFIEDQVYSKLL